GPPGEGVCVGGSAAGQPRPHRPAPHRGPRGRMIGICSRCALSRGGARSDGGGGGKGWGGIVCTLQGGVGQPAGGRVALPVEESPMGFVRRLGGAIVLLLSAVCFVCCVAAVVGVWVFRQSAPQRVETIAARLTDGLERASAANQNVRRAVAKARSEVAEVDKES